MKNDFFAYSLKDATPLSTITRVRDALANYGFFCKESWENIGTSSFSVQLSIPGTSIISNGKGITESLTLASAYGELSERLSLLLPFRVSPFCEQFYERILDDAIKTKLRIKKKNFKEWVFSEQATSFFSQVARSCTTEYSTGGIQEEWSQKEKSCPGTELFQEFMPALHSTCTYSLELPMAILDFYYGSNGMCAGNTMEEALVQGISEIIERYVQKKIILDQKVDIFDISDSYFSCHHELDNTISHLKNEGYSLTLLECTSSLPIPVVAAILKKQSGEYYASFGCHPNIYISIQRTVTELLQGYNIETLKSCFAEEYLFRNNDYSRHNNFTKLLLVGKGVYPISFIKGPHNVKTIDFNLSAKSNKEMYMNLVDAINNCGYNVFVHEGANLGLYTYHVIIPGISEVDGLFPSTKIRNTPIVSLSGNLDNLSTEEAYNLAEQYSVKYSNGATTLEKILTVDKYSSNSFCSTSLEGISSTLFIAMLYIKAGKWKRAITFIKLFRAELKGDPQQLSENLMYYLNLQSILEMLNAGWDYDSIKNVLDNEDEIELFDAITGEKRIFLNFPRLSPWDLLNTSPTLAALVDNEMKLLCNILQHVSTHRDQ